MESNSQYPPSSPTGFDQFSRDGYLHAFSFLLFEPICLLQEKFNLMDSFIKLIKLLFNENNFVTVYPSELTPSSYDFLSVKNLGTQVWDGCSSVFLF